MRDAGAGGREARDLGVREVHAVRAPDVAVQPAEPVEVLDRTAAVELAAVRLLLDGLGEVRVELEPEARARSSADSVIRRPVTENGEQGATAICTRAPRPLSCSSPARRSVSARTASMSSTSSSGGSPPSDTPRSIDPREATMRQPSSRAACTSASTSPVAAAREDVVVVEDGRAAGEHQLREPGARGRVLGLCVDTRPGRVELDEPFEERGLLRAGARERLVEVVVRVDEPRRDDGAGEVVPLVGLRLGARADLGHEAVLEQNPAVRVLGAGVVHRDDVRVREQ